VRPALTRGRLESCADWCTRSPATLRRKFASMASVHRVLGLTNPSKDEEVRVALKGMPRRKAEAGQGR
jgi:hypothetical protein